MLRAWTADTPAELGANPQRAMAISRLSAAIDPARVKAPKSVARQLNSSFAHIDGFPLDLKLIDIGVEIVDRGTT